MTVQYGPIGYSTLSTMSQIDMEEVKDVISRSAAEFALLEESYASLEHKFKSVTSERDELKSRLSQLEILLKGRQAALVSKEEECMSLRQRAEKPRSILSLRVATHAFFDPIITSTDSALPSAKFSPWLSVAKGVAPFMISQGNPVNLQIVWATHAVVDPQPELTRSPPPTVCRRRQVVSPPSSSDESSLSPRRSVLSARVRRSLDRYRESFATVRSSRTTVQSVSSSDSDGSLDELVSHAMRLSTASGRSSTSSSVVRGSVVMRASVDSTRSDRSHRSSFPKRWK